MKPQQLFNIFLTVSFLLSNVMSPAQAMTNAQAMAEYQPLGNLSTVELAAPELAFPLQAPAASTNPDRSLSPTAVEALPEVAPLPEAALPEEVANLPGATADWWAAVQERIKEDQYILTSGNAAGEGDDPDSFQGENPANHFQVDFTSGVVRLTPGDSAAETNTPLASPAWYLALQFTAYGYEGALQASVPPLEQTVESNSIQYKRGGLTEWYLNNERGLEQGFKLDRPPLGDALGRQLILEVALDTNLTPHLNSDRQSIDFLPLGPETGATILRYTDLYAYDANWDELPAHLELDAACAGDPGAACIRIVVDDTDAVYPITIDPLTKLYAWSQKGEVQWSGFGESVGTAGDVNGDGYADVVVGAPDTSNKVYIYYGSESGITVENSFVYTSPISGRFGYSVGTAGDVNGDGYDDVIVGDPDDFDPLRIFYGSQDGADKDNMVTFGQDQTQSGDDYGFSVSTAGDVNGDGFADVIAGDYLDTSDNGIAYLYMGSVTGVITTPVWVAHGPGNSQFGYEVGTAGDVNGDGYDDIIIGAPTKVDQDAGTVPGSVSVYYGGPGGLSEEPDWVVSPFSTEDDWSYFGIDVGTAGDVNGDGYDDVIVGASHFDNKRGKAFVYLGSKNGLAEYPAWVAQGETENDRYGDSVATAGDIDGDGYDDIIIGAPQVDGTIEHPDYPDVGKVYLYHGSAEGIQDGASWTFKGYDNDALLGTDAGTAGDVNGDGYADVIVGAPDEFDNGYGAALVFHGMPAPKPDWSAIGEEVDGYLGWAVGPAGDVNGDGYVDVLAGAYRSEADTGQVSLFPGGPFGPPDSAPAWTMTGENSGDEFGRSLGTAGDVNGDGYDDFI
ncbi:MAG: FG-GAP-like repeat-containing protein, partial [Chloroflexota bacterium]